MIGAAGLSVRVVSRRRQEASAEKAWVRQRAEEVTWVRDRKSTGRVACDTGGRYGERDAGRGSRLRRFVAADNEHSAGGLTHFADWDRDCGALAVAVEHDVDSDGKRRGADALRAGDGRNAAGRDSSDQSLEVGAEAFGADTVGERERQCAVERGADFGTGYVATVSSG